jgi:hypothetical protein
VATNEDIQGWERIAALITQEADLADLRAELIEKGIPVDERVEALRTLVRRKFQRAVREQTAREIEQSIAATEAQAKEMVLGLWLTF